ncbi:hypothetical protein [Pseudonocardia kunmingensis]|uniref:hypothetical protein n=1 Tax=Pseudonocardia kunmingensis TaxID=630975 RepID=UPI001B886B18|nr:hypothetical protein [Pseudonocardia kunmingensis]
MPQVGIALLRAPETGIAEGWAASLDGLAPEATVPTRAYSGRLGRAAPTPYVTAWAEPDAPRPAPYPHQRGLVGQWCRGESHGLDRVNHWAGQGAAVRPRSPPRRSSPGCGARRGNSSPDGSQRCG